MQSTITHGRLRSFSGLLFVLAALNGCEGDSEEAYPPEMLKDSSVDSSSGDTSAPDTSVDDTAIDDTSVDSTVGDTGDTGSGDTGSGDTAVDTAPVDTGPTCSDGVKNGTETDIDCGGSCPSKCADTKSCLAAADCTSAYCDATSKCATPTCTDGAKNGTETDVDCGGSCPSKCADTKSCLVAGDCTSAFCNASSKCATPTCTDGAKNGTETDIDCGGTCPSKCADTKGCAGPGDCTSGVCTASKCAAPLCTDTVKNGTETDVDCGGTCPSKCGDFKVCAVNTDCLSNICGTDKKCACPTGLTACGSICTDTGFDPLNCGTCGNICPAGSSCVATKCVVPGTLDTTFGAGAGWVRYQPTGFHNEWYALAMNPDNTMVFAGRDQIAGADEDWVVSKLKVDGSFDGTFGTGGSLHISAGSVIGERAKGIFRLPDGSFLVGGALYNSGTGFDACLAKVTATGALDTTWGTSGIACRAVAGEDGVEGMFVYPDGRVLLAGRAGSGTGADMQILRFLSTGALDSSFGTGGVVTFGTAGADDEAFGVAVDSTGKIVVVGFSDTDSVILKLTSTGGTDWSKTVDFTGATRNDQLRRVALAPGDVITAAGIAQGVSDSDFLVVRYSSAGVLDSTFGTAGVKILDRAATNEQLWSLTLVPTGDILVGGTSGNYPAAVARLKSNGALDPVFGTSGWFSNSFSSFSSAINAIAIDTLGRIVIGGSFGQVNPDYGAARLNP